MLKAFHKNGVGFPIGRAAGVPADPHPPEPGGHRR
jgi:hypothetical protein